MVSVISHTIFLIIRQSSLFFLFIPHRLQSDKFILSDPQFNSLANDMASFRVELNDLRASIQGLQNERISTSNFASVSPIPSLSSGASDSLSPLQTPSHAWVTSLAHELDDDRFFIPPLPDIASRGDDETTLSSVPQTPIIHPVRLPEHSHRSVNFDSHRMEKGFFHDQNLVERELKGHNVSPSEMLSRTKTEAIGSEGILSPLSCISSLRLYSEPSLHAERPGDGLNAYPNKMDYSNPQVHIHLPYLLCFSIYLHYIYDELTSSRSALCEFGMPPTDCVYVIRHLMNLSQFAGAAVLLGMSKTKCCLV